MARTNETPEPVGKGHATPTRKEREAERRRPLVLDRKVDSKRRRAERRTQLDRESKAMLTGDDRHMPAMHQGAPRRFARDFVDSRTTVGEFLLPASFVALVIMMFFATNVALVGTSSLVLLLLLVSWLVESSILVRRLRKQATEKFGADRLPPRYRLYAFTRMAQMRRLRMPKPQVRRGNFPI